MACSMYLSCVNVNSIDSMVSWGLGVYGLGCSCGTPWIYMIIFKWRFARHMHFVVRHEHCSIHDGDGCLVCGWLLLLLAFTSVWCLVWAHDLIK